LVLLPAIILYTARVHWILRGKVRAEVLSD
jgi:hypothetical protein